MDPSSTSRGLIAGWLARLRFPWIAGLLGLLFFLDLALPDPLPFADELFLGLLTALFTSWKRRRAGGVQGSGATLPTTPSRPALPTTRR